MIPPDSSEAPPGLAEIDRALAESREREKKLLHQREQLLLNDPHQREERRRSRDSLIGRWCSSKGLSAGQVADLKNFDPALAWVLGPVVLRADGWTEDSASKSWLRPVSDSGSRAD